MGGDLNFSMGLSEAWGPNALVDPPSDYFLHKLSSSGLVDVDPIKPRPTWRNKRVGGDRIAKRLGRFLLKEELVGKIVIFRNWIGEGGDLDHIVISLELTGMNKKLGAPFKFNPSWLNKASFNNLFHSVWKEDEGDFEGEKGFLFMRKLK